MIFYNTGSFPHNCFHCRIDLKFHIILKSLNSWSFFVFSEIYLFYSTLFDYCSVFRAFVKSKKLIVWTFY